MKKFPILALVAVMAFGSCGAQKAKKKAADDSKPTIAVLSASEFKKQIFDYNKFEEGQKVNLLSDTPVVIDFYADWCGPCRAMSPILEELAEELKGKVTFYKVNTDNESYLAKVMQVNGIPHFVFIDKAGNVSSAKGSMPKADFLKLVQQNALK